MTIWGWTAVIEYTKLNDQMIKRAMALYGFPRPVRVRKGNSTINVWDEPLVSEWMRRNHMTYFMQRHRKKLQQNIPPACAPAEVMLSSGLPLSP